VKRFVKILRNIFLTLVALIAIAAVLINMSSVQTYLAQYATKKLSEKLHTNVWVKNVRINLLNNVLLEGLYIEDQQKDTLAYIGKAQVRVTDWFFLKKTVPVLHYIGLSNAYIHLYRSDTSKLWNYAFIEDAFSGDTQKKKTGTPQEFQLDLEKLMLDNVRFHMDDAWGGYDYDLDIGSFAANVDDIDFKKKMIAIKDINLKGSSIRLRDYVGGKPPGPKRIPVIDTTPFNPGLWKVNIEGVKLDDIHFAFVSKTGAAYPNEFDPEHIDIKELNSDIKYLKIVGDTLKAQLAHFSAKERSGFMVKELQAEVSVSPVASICSDLYLETNNSKISDYYAMHYQRFPDFTDYIAKVRMVGRLKKSAIDARDVAYFAPQLRSLPLTIVTVSGLVDGTVAQLNGKDVFATDGFSTIKGNFRITGLPDIDKTIFDFQNGEIFTTGSSILKYAPVLKDNPSLNLKVLDYAYFSGNFKGLLSDFATQGTFKTNLGTITTDAKMKLPAKREATYSGSISSQGFNIGRLFNQPLLGTTTFNAELEGASFDMDGIKIKAASKFRDFTFNGYVYKDIVADGTFDNKRFDGKLLLNDSNIALGFYGSIDLSQKDLNINATANLLSSDLQALHFSNIPTTLSADFDLNCSGKTIDDFIGAAKLYNINLLRNAKRLDLDSINISSDIENGEKHIHVESNLLSAQVSGQFLLTEIPNSMQYYLSKYLPNYIKSSGKIAADQNINFMIRTREVNDLISAFSNSISGFDSATVTGNLNTLNQTLTLDAAVPYGKLSTIKLYNTTLSGKGDFNRLRIKSSVQTFVVGNNVLNTSLDLDAGIGNDSLEYTIETKSDQQIGTAKLSGQAYASNDSLFMKLLPSEFFINNAKWEIPSGNTIVYAEKYLFIDNLKLTSGLQSIAVSSDVSAAGIPLVVRASNIDIGQLASLTAIADYQPDGRINGELRVGNLFSNQLISANIDVNEAKFGADTIGRITLKGYYDAEKQLLSLEKNSGVFNDKFLLTTEGNVSFDPKNEDQIDGAIKIENFPVKLLDPFLKGYASRLGGTINGDVKLKGTMDNPKLKGALDLLNIVARVDYTGTLYTIPKGRVKVEDKTLTLDNIELLDVYKNTAVASGYLRFNRLSNPDMNIRLNTDQFEVVNLRDYENELFYGHVIAKTNFTIAGSVSDMRMTINATPMQKSNLYIPYNGAGDISTNTYISFKSYDKTGSAKPKKVRDKLSVRISAVLNTLMEVSLVLDPMTGDQITATGTGNLSINVPANDDYSMFGTYNIEYGSYIFTFRQVLTKTFNINSGSSIAFSGNISNTRLNVNATYPTRGRLYDLLDAYEVESMQRDNPKELDDARITQAINVQLRMQGTLASPDLSYEIELPERRSIGTVAYAKLSRINQSDKSALTNQVSALLFLGSFIPSQGISSTLAVSGAKNTLGETLAGQASPVLTNALNKLLGDRNFQVLVQYRSYGQQLGTTTGGVAPTIDSRDEVKVGIGKNYLNDRLKLQVGSSYDWGRPSSTATAGTTSNFNLAGDFRAQYLLTADGGVNLLGFRSSNYDLFQGANITRTGVGVSFRKSFDNFYEFIHTKKRIQRENAEKARGAKP
jgi:hypothetical protein